MVLAITTKENVKAALFNKTGSVAEDALIDSYIAGVSQAAETYLGRTLLQGRNVEIREVKPYVELLTLYCTPIVSITGILWSRTDDFTDNQAVEREAYILRANLGQITWRYLAPFLRTGGYVQITYMGGMAASQAAFQAAFPDIEVAAREEVVNILSRRGQPGGASTLLNGGGTVFDKELTQLQYLRRALGGQKQWRLQ